MRSCRNCGLLLLLLLPVCALAAQPEQLTIDQLLNRPHYFNGKRVSVVGYYVAANEESTLFPTAHAGKHADLSHAIWVEPKKVMDLTPFTARYVRVVGIFRYRAIDPKVPRGFGHMNVSPTALFDATFFRLR